MDAGQVKQRVHRGLFWIGAASAAIGVLDLGAMVALPWFLGPAQLGVAAVAVWLFPIFDVFTDAGLSLSIIRRDEVSPERLSTIFWLNFALSLAAGAIILGLAPVLTGDPVASAILMVYAAKLVFHNVYFVPQALLKRELRFKELSLIRLGANLAMTGVKVGSAAAGAGPWCFLLGHLAHTLVTAAGIQARHPWRPRLVLRLRDAAEDVRFGLKTALREILFFFYTNVDYRVVFAFFGKAAAGGYKFSYELVLDPVRAIALVFNDTALPAFARLRGDRTRLVEQFIAYTRMNLCAVLPLLAFLGIEADDLIRIVFPDRWIDTVPAVRVLCIVGLLRGMSLVVPPLFDAIGKPMVTLAYTAVASVLLPSFYLLFAWLLGPRFGYVSVAIAWAVGYPCAFALLAWLALSALELPVRAYLGRIVGIPACVAFGAAAAVLARIALDGQGPGVRLGAAAVALCGTTGVLLARFQGISPRTIVRALRGR